MPEQPLPAIWEHTTTAQGIDQGMVYRYFWQNLGVPENRFHQMFQTILVLVGEYILIKL